MLHDNGFKLAATQREMTPIQKYVYIKARAYHIDNERDHPSTNMNKLQQLR